MPRNLLGVCVAIALAVAQRPMLAQPRVLDLGHGIFEAIGVAVGTGGDRTVALPASNTFLVTTPAGNVIIDTSLAAVAPAHKEALTARNSASVKAIILTHAHADHTGGVNLWRASDTAVIAHKANPEFVAYLQRLSGFYARRNAAQFGGGAVPGLATGSGQTIPPAPTRTFDERETLMVGDVEFTLLHTPGETPDHLTVWMPQFKTAFIGDNYYESFPNLYTLRGTRPRWALDYVESLNRVLALEPELLLPSHGQPIRGRDEVKRRLTQYRDAILYVHDATLKGMNAGKDVFALMREIKLPPALDVGESYGKLTWSIRGIYEGYVGWFDGNPTTMYDVSPREAYPEVVAMAGGPEAVAARAQALAATDPVRALALTDMALAADASHLRTLEVRLAILRALDRASKNSNERGWLAAAMRDVETRLKR
jgi:alkyl sulfatase BDS1-like metallo-beta-lactamase superfamily hydrolase